MGSVSVSCGCSDRVEAGCKVVLYVRSVEARHGEFNCLLDLEFDVCLGLILVNILISNEDKGSLLGF